MPYARASFLARACGLLLVLAAVAPPAAADDDKRLAQARESLRRAQQSLQATQAQRDALAQDKARLEQQKLESDKALADAGAKQRDAAARGRRLDAGMAELRAERDRLQAELARGKEAAGAQQQRIDDAQAKLADAETRVDEQRRTTIALRGLLQRSVQALAENERQNRALYELGHRAIAGYTECETHGSSSPDANLFGIGDVRVTDVAEQLRREMDSVATPATLTNAARPGAVPAPDAAATRSP
jgi:septal ring factor EnvC (AmiA/AmiB activator)